MDKGKKESSTGWNFSLQGQTGLVHGSTGPAEKIKKREDTPASGPRCRLVSWNAGGLSDTVNAELAELCQGEQAPDILNIQETHWNFYGTWMRNGCTYFHSSLSKCSPGGVMTAAPACSIMLLHLGMKWSQVDFFGTEPLYQISNAGMDGETKKCRLQEKKAIWNKLDKLIHSIPVRSMWVVCGPLQALLFTGGTAPAARAHQGRLLVLGLIRLQLVGGRPEKDARYTADFRLSCSKRATTACTGAHRGRCTGQGNWVPSPRSARGPLRGEGDCPLLRAALASIGVHSAADLAEAAQDHTTLRLEVLDVVARATTTTGV